MRGTVLSRRQAVQPPRPLALVPVFALFAAGAAAQSGRQTVDLVVQAGRPLRVVLDRRLRLRRVGQAVTGTLIEPVYAYDRIVVPAGTGVRGHVKAFESIGGAARVRTIL